MITKKINEQSYQIILYDLINSKYYAAGTVSRETNCVGDNYYWRFYSTSQVQLNVGDLKDLYEFVKDLNFKL